MRRDCRTRTEGRRDGRMEVRIRAVGKFPHGKASLSLSPPLVSFQHHHHLQLEGNFVIGSERGRPKKIKGEKKSGRPVCSVMLNEEESRSLKRKAGPPEQFERITGRPQPEGVPGRLPIMSRCTRRLPPTRRRAASRPAASHLARPRTSMVGKRECHGHLSRKFKAAVRSLI